MGADRERSHDAHHVRLGYGKDVERIEPWHPGVDDVTVRADEPRLASPVRLPAGRRCIIRSALERVVRDKTVIS
jgi:hypothetical protein